MNKMEYLAFKCVLMDWRKGTKESNKEEVKEFKKKMKVTREAMDVNVIDNEDDKYVIDVKYLVRVYFCDYVIYLNCYIFQKIDL